MDISSRGKFLLCLVLWGWGLTGWAGEGKYEELWHNAAVDHVDAGLAILILKSENGFFVRNLDLSQLNIPIPAADPFLYKREHFYPARSIEGYEFRVDSPSRRVHFFNVERPHLLSPPSDDLLLTITANGRPLRHPQLVLHRNGELHLPKATLQALGVDLQKLVPSNDDDAVLHHVAGENFIIDYRKLSLEMMIFPELFSTSKLDVSEVRSALQSIEAEDHAVPVQRKIAAVLSYQLSGGSNPDGAHWTSGFYDVSLGVGPGTCRVEYLDSALRSKWQRFSSNCVYDWPDSRRSAVVGDTIGGGGQLTGSVRYAGIQLRTDFELQPELLTIPGESFAGIADVPSTLEVWVDENVIMRTDIAPGPFQVEDVPLRSGAGEVRAVVRSPYGERQIFSSAFYADSSLLAPGLTDWSINAGRLRKDFVTPEDHYGERFAAMSFRRGLNRKLTAGLSVQAAEAFQLAGVSSAFTVGNLAVVDAALAVSENLDGKGGAAYRARLSHHSRYFSASYSMQKNSPQYTELAYFDLSRRPESRRQLRIGFSMGGALSFNITDRQQRYFDADPLNIRHASLGLRLGRHGSLRFSALFPENRPDETVYAAQLTIPLGNSHSGSATARTDGADRHHQVDIRKSLPAGPGYGYRFDIGNNGISTNAMADVQIQNAMGQVALRGYKLGEAETVSANLGGSVVVSEEGIDLTRHSSGSFAVIDVGMPDVAVHHDGQLKAYTNENGKALLAGLRSYENNSIRIKKSDVPLNVHPQALVANLKPGRRELLVASFKFRQEQYVTGQLHAADGVPIPPGSLIKVGSLGESLVGHDGKFFVSAPNTDFSLGVMSHNRACTVAISLPEEISSPVIDMGTLVCTGEE